MVKTVGKMSKIERPVKINGTKIGTAVISFGKAWQSKTCKITRARVDIMCGDNGLFAMMDKTFIRPISDKIRNDKSFRSVYQDRK